METTLNMAIKVVKASQPGAGTDAAQTGDLGILAIFGLCLFAVLGAIFVRKYFSNKNWRNGSHTQNAVTATSIISKILIVSVCAVATACLAIGLTANAKAFAEGESDPSLVPDKNVIDVVLNDDGTLTFDTCMLKNVSDGNVTIDSSVVNTADEVADVQGIENTNIKIGGFGGTVFEGNPSSSQYATQGLTSIAPEESAELAFDMNFENESVIDNILGKKVFNITLYVPAPVPPVPPTPSQYTLSFTCYPSLGTITGVDPSIKVSEGATYNIDTETGYLTVTDGSLTYQAVPVPNPGCVFNNWTISPLSNEETEIKSDIIFTAHFSEEPVPEEFKGLKLTNLNEGGQSTFIFGATPEVDIQYSFDGEEWADYPDPDCFEEDGYKIVLDDDYPHIYFRGDNDNLGYLSFNIYEDDAKIAASGNINSLLDSENFETLTDLSDEKYENAFWNLFRECSGLISVSELRLPATKLSVCAYAFMFYRCSSLVDTPSISATEFAPSCCQSMFEGCTSLTKSGVFADNPILTEDDDSDFMHMYAYCSGITEIPSFPFKTPGSACFNDMFGSCTGLVDLSNLELKVENVMLNCYDSMFKDCSNLKIPPKIIWESIEDNSGFWDMFNGCASLCVDKADATHGKVFFTTPDEEVESACYNMFEGADVLFDELEPSTSYRYVTSDETFKVNFDMQGHGTAVDEQTIKFGETVEKPADPTDASWTFEGWYKDSQYATPWDFANDVIKKDTTIYAKWESITRQGVKFTVDPGKNATVEIVKGTGMSAVNSQLGLDDLNNSINDTLPVFSYSFNGIDNWQPYVYDEETNALTGAIALSDSQPCVYIKGNNPNGIANLANISVKSSDGTGCVSASGNINSLLDNNDGSYYDDKPLPDYCYAYLFAPIDEESRAWPPVDPSYGLKSTPSLPSTQISEGCYMVMFAMCKNLTTLTKLPQATLKDRCYMFMFLSCSSLSIKENPTDETTVFFECPSTEGVDGPVDGMFFGTPGPFMENNPNDNNKYGICNPDFEPFALTADTANSSVSYNIDHYYGNLEEVDLWYSNSDSGPWTKWEKNTPVTLNKDEKIYIKGCNTSSGLCDGQDYTYFVMPEGSSFSASGNLTALITNGYSVGMGYDASCPLKFYCFKSLFQNCVGLHSAPSLPYTYLDDDCYDSMFSGCSTLENPPVMVNAADAQSAYQHMFDNCTSLASVPNLNIVSDNYSCLSMFSGCSSLVDVSALHLSGSGQRAFYNMFKGCSKLQKAPTINSTGNSSEEYGHMFDGCSALTDVSNIDITISWNETEWSESTCSYMFYYCTSLTNAPKITITGLVKKQTCSYMFGYCSNLVDATNIKLESTTAAPNCYSYMFYSCNTLRIPPVIKLTDTANGCCEGMFKGCSSLVVQTSATEQTKFFQSKDSGSTGAYKDMFKEISGGDLTVTDNTDYYYVAPSENITDENQNDKFSNLDGAANEELEAQAESAEAQEAAPVEEEFVTDENNENLEDNYSAKEFDGFSLENIFPFVGLFITNL